jgi:hypothetical protein
VKIDKKLARAILYEETAKAAAGYIDTHWEKRIDSFSQACERYETRTHIAFLGTALLAKCVRLDADAFSVKEGERGGGPTAYSARGLCHSVLVPNAPELDINLGVTGREPLNNQPYFRIDRVSRDVPIRANTAPLLEQLLELLSELQAVHSDEEARQALRAFIAVRRRHGLRYSSKVEVRSTISSDELPKVIAKLVAEQSEGGKRAQAVVAGLMSLVVGSDRVAIRRVNDPDRNLPGDVGIRQLGVREVDRWERVLEVRDKPVKREDLYLLATKAVGANVADAAIVAVAAAQPEIAIEEARRWAAERGVVLTVFLGWEAFIRQALFWSATPQTEAATALPGLIYERLVELEVSQEGVGQWLNLVGQAKEEATDDPESS